MQVQSCLFLYQAKKIKLGEQVRQGIHVLILEIKEGKEHKTGKQAW